MPEAVILAEDPDMTPETGADRERSHVVFGQATIWRTLAKVVSVRPRGLYEVEIEAATEDPSVHTADVGAVAPPIHTSLLPRRLTAPVLRGLLARRMPGDTTRALLAWQPAPGAELYQIEMAEGADPADAGVSWTRAGDTTATHYVLALLYASRTLSRVRGLGLAAGPWVAASIGILIPEMWITDPTPNWTTDPTAMWVP